jgi:hypothetical protein
MARNWEGSHFLLEVENQVLVNQQMIQIRNHRPSFLLLQRVYSQCWPVGLNQRASDPFLGWVELFLTSKSEHGALIAMAKIPGQEEDKPLARWIMARHANKARIIIWPLALQAPAEKP